MSIVATGLTGIYAQQRDMPPKWELTESAHTIDAGEDGKINSGDTQATVAVRDMYIYIGVDRPTTVKLFTILGQPVSQVNLPAGTSRFKVSARGIYILKIGSATRRVTI